MSDLRFDSIDAAVEASRSDPDGLLLDVRTAEEYASGHIPGSVNVPLETLSRFDADVPGAIYVYCRSGSRSARAAALLAQMDYEAVNIGGIIDYRGELER